MKKAVYHVSYQDGLSRHHPTLGLSCKCLYKHFADHDLSCSQFGNVQLAKSESKASSATFYHLDAHLNLKGTEHVTLAEETRRCLPNEIVLV